MTSILFILFLLWGLPLTWYRSRFRKMVYQTDSWTINLQPRFGRELKALLGNTQPHNPEYLRLRNFYRGYLAVYLLLLLAWQAAKNNWLV